MAHSKHIKGQNVNLLIGGSVVAASESCDFTLTANTSDSAAKDDPGLGEWDNASFENYSWSCSNQSFLVDYTYLRSMLNTIVNGDAKFTVKFQFEIGCTGNEPAVTGTAIITSFEVDAPADGKVKVNMSFEGCEPLSITTASTISAASSINTRIKGKALMIALDDTENIQHTIMCATGHKLTVNIQTGDITDKDSNDNFQYKEVTGRSVKLTTENLIPAYSADDSGISPKYIMGNLISGTSVSATLGYYSSAIGSEATNHDWGEADVNIIYGTFLITSFQMNGQVKQNATYSAELTCLGKPTVATA